MDVYSRNDQIDLLLEFKILLCKQNPDDIENKYIYLHNYMYLQFMYDTFHDRIAFCVVFSIIHIIGDVLFPFNHPYSLHI